MDYCKNAEELRNVLEASKALSPAADAVGREIVSALRGGGKILTCGNGGSAADALHMSEEFVGRFSRERRSLPAVCLCADPTLLTCILNDYGADRVFSRQVESLGREGDLLFGFTTSGNSRNIVEAFAAAKKRGVKTVLVSGKGGGRLRGAADFELIVPSSSTARIQEVHTLFLHSWLEAVDEAFVGSGE
ncbi:MAG: phosphoheptose isomerase [Verrucomicrobia bacterium]|nr:MAG: phosphoheptose isomerase [Verrucomicrobiota bacterium]